MAIRRDILDHFRVCQDRGEWEDRNIPPPTEGSDDLQLGVGICPNFALLCETAGLLGISEESLRGERKFCGRVIVGVNNLAPLSGLCGKDYHPEMVCVRIARALEYMLTTIESGGDEETEFANLREGFKSEDPGNVAMDNAFSTLRQMRVARFSLRRLLENVPKVDDPARSRNRDEAIEYAKAMLESLITQVTGDTDLLSLFLGSGVHCEQHPIKKSFGVMS